MIEYLDADARAVLTRRWPTPFGLFGEWTMPEFSCFTLERPWLGNAPRVSCIPAAVYPMREGHFYRGDYPCLEILEVPGRSLIKAHAGNLLAHSLGCPLVGDRIGWLDGGLATATEGWLDGGLAVLNSRATLRVLLEVWRQYKVDLGTLEIVWDLQTEGVAT